MFYMLHPISNIIDLNLIDVTDSKRATVYFLAEASQAIASWTAVIVTYQRYVAVSRPLHARQHITTSRARVAVVIVWIGSFIICLPFRYVVHHDSFPFYLYVIIFTCIVFLLPMSLTVFLNIRLIVVVRRSRTFVGQQLASGGNNDSRNASSNRVTVTLIVILIVYLVCQLPMVVVIFLAEIGIRDVDIHNCAAHHTVYYHALAGEISACLIVVNSLADCVTYCIMGKRFRQFLIRELLCRRDNGK
jgi:hypothetical protein